MTRFAILLSTTPTIAEHAKTRMWPSVLARRCGGLLLLMLVAFVVLPGNAHAAGLCLFNNTWSAVTFQLPSHIDLPANPVSGQTVLWQSGWVSGNMSVTPLCFDAPDNGIKNHVGTGHVSGDDTLFTFTFIPSLSGKVAYRIIRGDTHQPLHAYPNQTNPPANFTFDFPYRLQLIWLAPLTANSITINFQLGAWEFETIFGNPQVVDFQLNGTSSLSPPACTVVTNPKVVQLPTVWSSNFTGPNSTAGQTPFDVALDCPAAGTQVSITLNTNAAPATNVTGQGVIAPTSTPGDGHAAGVGVQLLDADGNPITFGTAVSAGATTQGAFSIPLQARYYQTGTHVSGGTVTATATYTLTYQ